jgi:ribosomal protein S18 acetylase RimI-like enzyme
MMSNMTKKDRPTPELEYVTSDGRDLELIRALREKIRQFHVERSKHFKKRITEFSIEEMNRKMLEKATGGVYLDLVKDKVTERLIGYCLTYINVEKCGEIASIYLEPEYRRHDIGSRLVTRAMDWMDRQGAVRQILAVGSGNEEVVDFYRRLGFEVRSIIMERLPGQ